MKNLLIIYLLLTSLFNYAYSDNLDEISINLNIDIYNRYNFKKYQDKDFILLIENRVINRIEQVTSALGYDSKILRSTPGMERKTTIGHFDIKIEMAIYPELELQGKGKGDETFAYIVSKRCDGDVFQFWSASTPESTIDFLVSAWDDYILSKLDVRQLKKCPFKFKTIKNVG